MTDNAKRFDVAGVKNFSDCLDKMEREINSFLLIGNGLHTEIASLDRLNPKGMRGGELWVLAAPPGVGKSSLALQIATNQALLDIPVLFFSMEMGLNAVSEKIVQAASERETITKYSIDTTRAKYLNRPLYIGRAISKPNIDGMMDVLREATKRYGLKMIAFDHLHFLCRSLTNQVQEIGLAVQAFKLLAEEMEIPIILVAQPRKVDLSKPMTAEDLKDSSSIHSDADGIIILHRKRVTGDGVCDKNLDPITMVRYEKTRYGKGGECLLYFHGEYSKFEELEA
jgi:replicative DNA helicase